MDRLLTAILLVRTRSSMAVVTIVLLIAHLQFTNTFATNRALKFRRLAYGRLRTILLVRPIPTIVFPIA